MDEVAFWGCAEIFMEAALKGTHGHSGKFCEFFDFEWVGQGWLVDVVDEF